MQKSPQCSCVVGSHLPAQAFPVCLMRHMYDGCVHTSFNSSTQIHIYFKEQVPITHFYLEIGYLDGYFKYFNGKRNGSTELIPTDNRLGILKPNSGSTGIFQPYNSCLAVTMMTCLKEGHVSETKPTCPGRAQNQEVYLK